MMYFLPFCFHFLVASDGVITQWKKYGFYLHEVIRHTLECLFIQLLNFFAFIYCVLGVGVVHVTVSVWRSEQISGA